jgi:CRISPR-associated protein Cmr6
VKPGARFLAAVTAPPDLLGPAQRCLLEALELWGIGGKTAAGYGRLVVDRANTVAAPAAVRAKPRSAKLDELSSWMEQPDVTLLRPVLRLDAIERDWLEALAALSAADRHEARRLVRAFISEDKRTKERLRNIVAKLSGSGD